MRGIRFAIAFVVAWSLQAGVSFAAADWLDKLSGPGPFSELFTGYRFLCLSNAQDQIDVRPGDDKRGVTGTFLWPWDRTATVVPRGVPRYDEELLKIAKDPKNPTADEMRRARTLVDCKSDRGLRGYLTTTVYWKKSTKYVKNGTDHNDLVDGDQQARHVAVEGLDVGYVDRISDTFDVGMAVGYKTFSGLAFGSLTKWYVAPSIEFAPFGIAGDQPWSHSVKLTVGWKIFLGQFESKDFCDLERSKTETAHPFTCANPTWRSDGRYELVPTVGIVIDTSVVNGFRFWR